MDVHQNCVPRPSTARSSRLRGEAARLACLLLGVAGHVGARSCHSVNLCHKEIAHGRVRDILAYWVYSMS